MFPCVPLYSDDSHPIVPVFVDTPILGIAEDYLPIQYIAQVLVFARQQLMTRPIFQNALISPDGNTAGLLVGFSIDETSRTLLARRTELRNLERDGGLTVEETLELMDVEAGYATDSVIAADRQHEIIGDIRNVLDNHKDSAQIYLGGAPMLADDLVPFVEDDLRSFSIAVVLLIIVVLGLKYHLVVLPLLLRREA